MNTVSSILSHAATFVELDERGCFRPTVANGAVQTGYNPDHYNKLMYIGRSLENWGGVLKSLCESISSPWL